MISCVLRFIIDKLFVGGLLNATQIRRDRNVLLHKVIVGIKMVTFHCHQGIWKGRF